MISLRVFEKLWMDFAEIFEDANGRVAGSQLNATCMLWGRNTLSLDPLTSSLWMKQIMIPMESTLRWLLVWMIEAYIDFSADDRVYAEEQWLYSVIEDRRVLNGGEWVVFFHVWSVWQQMDLFVYFRLRSSDTDIDGKGCSKIEHSHFGVACKKL